MGALFPFLKEKKGALLLIVGLGAGLLLLFFGSGEAKTTSEQTTPTVKEEMAEVDDYISVLEYRLKELLETMDGVSDVHLILLPDTCTEVVYAQNGTYSEGYLTQKEYVLTDVDGDEEPIRLKLVYPKLRGASVVCRGGSNPILQEKIVSLLSSLLDLPTNRVYVTG